MAGIASKQRVGVEGAARGRDGLRRAVAASLLLHAVAAAALLDGTGRFVPPLPLAADLEVMMVSAAVESPAPPESRPAQRFEATAGTAMHEVAVAESVAVRGTQPRGTEPGGTEPGAVLADSGVAVVRRPVPPAATDRLALPAAALAARQPVASGAGRAPRSDASPALSLPGDAGAPRPPDGAAPRPAAAAWRGAVLAWVEAHKTYPRDAQRRGVEGVVMVRVTAEPDGRVIAVLIEESAGSALLDDAVRRLFEGARLPPYEADGAETSRMLGLRVGFALRDAP